MQPIKVIRLRDTAVLPTYGSAEAAGADLYACLDADVTIAPGESVFIPTGLAMEIPKNCAGLIYARSGLACKRGLAPANKVGVVDSDYRGEFLVVLHNHSDACQTISHGERIAQLMVIPFVAVEVHTVEELTESQRGDGGFGSTGTN